MQVTPAEYIEQTISSLEAKMAGVSLSYSFDKMFGQHVIQVRPAEAFHQEEFAKYQIEFESKFLELYPYEDIYFVGEDEVENLPIFNEPVHVDLSFEGILSSSNYLLDLPIIMGLEGRGILHGGKGSHFTDEVLEAYNISNWTIKAKPCLIGAGLGYAQIQFNHTSFHTYTSWGAIKKDALEDKEDDVTDIKNAIAA